MTIEERKLKVAQLMMKQAIAWDATFKYNENEPTQLEKHTYQVYRQELDDEIFDLVPRDEKLSICLTGVAEEGVSHYDIEDLLQTEFKHGEGVQYDSESSQFWMYVKPSLVQQVLRFIDYNFPRRINLYVEPNYGDKNPWFQNWNQARKYLETVVGA